jgi:hypothetical protein
MCNAALRTSASSSSTSAVGIGHAGFGREGPTVRRNVVQDQRECPDASAEPNLDWTEDLRICANVDSVTDHRRTPAWNALPQGDPMAQRHALADPGVGVNSDPTEMMDAEAGADDCLLWQADSGACFNHAVQQPVSPPKEAPLPTRRQPIYLSAQPVHPYRPPALLAQPRVTWVSGTVGRSVRVRLKPEHEHTLAAARMIMIGGDEQGEPYQT